MESVNNPSDNRQIARVLNQVVRQFDAVGSVTLANSVTTTTVNNPKVVASTKIFLQPRTSAAVTASAYISSVSTGSFVITHASGTSSRVFDYLLMGV